MKATTPKLTTEVWKKLMIVGEKQGTIRLKDLAQEIGLNPEDTLVFLREVFPSGAGAEIYSHENECMVDIDASSLQYMLPLSPSEWMQLHHILQQIPSSQMIQNPVLNSLTRKLTENGPIKVVMELLNQLELWDQQLNESQQSIVQQLDQAVAKKTMVKINTLSGKCYHVFPCKILHLEGKLSMIAEDVQDHCLTVISVTELESCIELEEHGSPRVTNFEIEEFITAIRTMNEKETRLILKIHDPQSVNLFPDHHFLGKPCMITNPNGDLIWAAYVEPGEDLFEWLISLGQNVEVLDPVKFKDEFLMYCEEKLRKIA